MSNATFGLVAKQQMGNMHYFHAKIPMDNNGKRNTYTELLVLFLLKI
jgi:hypothetical protein